MTIEEVMKEIDSLVGCAVGKPSNSVIDIALASSDKLRTFLKSQQKELDKYQWDIKNAIARRPLEYALMMTRNDESTNTILITREEVLQAVKGHPQEYGIMLYIDTLLNGSREHKAALEMACTDYHGWHYATTMGCRRVEPDHYITKVREANDVPKI